MWRRSYHIISATLIMAAACIADDSAAGRERKTSFLAVGDSPPFRQEIRDGVRYEIEPPAGTIPPRDVLAGLGGKKSDPVPLRLGRPSPWVTVPPGDGPLQLWRADDAADVPPWLAVSRPPDGDFLVLLWRKPAARSWLEASAITLPRTPAGMARIVNLFPSAVSIDWGGESLPLKPGRSVLRQTPPDKPVTLRVMSRDSQGTMKKYHSGVVSGNAGESSLVTIYRADGPAPRRPLKVAVIRNSTEPTPPVAP
jgi:hypothetical protein